MRFNRSGYALGVAITALALPTLANAQDATATAQEATTTDLMAMSDSSLRGEIQTRYDAALALSQDATVVSADTNQYMWATQAKVQCGIALGFLKSGEKDAVSVGKCDDAYRRMQMAPPPPPPAAPSALCDQPIAGIVFFDWDSAVPPVDAPQILDSVATSFKNCGWSGLVVTGHTDRSGSDAYNQGLSLSRANAIAQLLTEKGLNSGQMVVSGRGESEPKTPTIDGERNPTNRRVEVTVQ